MQYVFMSHDVDWRLQGAPLDHIIARKDRFNKEILENIQTKNPYYNIPHYMAIEDKFDVRSTFFFRTIYENGDYRDYEDDIRALIDGGWEVGLHCDPSSIDNIDRICEEKGKLEILTKNIIKSNRVHYMAFNRDLPRKLQKLGFVYDSSIRNSKDRINKDEMGYSVIGKLIEFPVTLMDAYMFTFMKLKEDQIIPTFESTLNYSRSLGGDFNIITVIWHDNVLQMKGGRMYEKILEYLTSEDDVKVSRGIDLTRMIKTK
jgi:peptidoglycan/xylan/chitin deacetylase (PgdA/CDA1 family)